MNYAEYEEWIKQAAESASDQSRIAFAIDTLSELHLEARGAIQNECTEQERELMSRILRSLEEDVDQLGEKLEELDGLLYQDPARKIRYIPSLMEFICGLEHYLDYRKSANPAYIAAIGLNMINVIDFDVSGQIDGYSMNDMLVSEDMRAEIERQEQALLNTGG